VSVSSVPGYRRQTCTQWLTEARRHLDDVTVTPAGDATSSSAPTSSTGACSWHRHADGSLRRDHRHLTGAHALTAGSALARPAVAATTADLSTGRSPICAPRDPGRQRGALRVTYLGELGWELHIPTDYAVTVFDALFAAGADLGIRNAGIGALNSLRLEKGYRDYGLDIDNSDSLIDVGLDFTVAWDKPDGFIGRDALVKQRDSGVRTSRMVQVFVNDPEPLLYGDEQLYRDGVHVGENRIGGYGHTLGGSVGLAMIERDEDTDDAFIASGSWELDIVGRRYPVRLSLAPMYDPTRERIKA
jgi:4-methylaminobutanoate oxidase (formaldehyde-forming)